MTSNTIRAFALGLIVSTTILAVVFHFSTKEEKLTQDEMIELLEKDNYIVTKITEDTTTDESTTNEEVAPEVETPKEETMPQQSEQTTETPTVETPVTTITLTIESGMNVRDVGNTLEANGVVNSDEFYQAVLDSGKETKMKQGTFDIPSNATSTEVIGIIFK